MRTKKLYILRHGETDQNLRGIVQGRGINSILNETGIRQAQAFYHQYKNISFDHIRCSSQLRSYQTIQHFDSCELPILKDPRLDEIGWGEHEGKAGDPELMDKYYRIIQSWSNGNYHDAAHEGESAHALSLRLHSFLDDIYKLEFTNALICTHGRTLRAMICLLKKQELMHMEKVSHSNTGLYVAEFKDSAWQIVTENDCKHLTKSIER